MDSHKNFAWTTVLTPPSPAVSGTSLILASGAGALMPTPPFNATICPADTVPTTLNAEIVRVTAVTGDTVTSMQRAREGTTARTILAGDVFDAGITVRTLTDVESPVTALLDSVSALTDTQNTQGIQLVSLAFGNSLNLQNVDVSALAAGMPVYAFGSGAVKRASNAAAGTKHVIGLVLDSNIDVSAVGPIAINGKLVFGTATWDAVVTGQSGGLTPGATYYLSPIAGKLVQTAPVTGAVRPVGIATAPDTMELLLADYDDATSDLAALSTALNVLSQGQSVLNQAVSVLSQSNSALSQAVSIISQGLSVEIAARIAKDDVLSNQLSVVSSQVSTVSVAVTSVDTRVNTVSNQVSVLNQAVSVLSQQLSVVSQQVSVLSQAHSVLSQTVSALNQQVSSEISNRVSADNFLSVVIQGVSNAASNALSVASQALSLISAVSARNTAATSVKGLQSAINALSGRISAIAGGAGSVTSTEVSAVSAQAASAINVVSNAVSILSQSVSVLSQAVSVLSQAHSALSQQVSVLSSQVSTVSVAVTSVDSHVNTVSNAVSIVSTAASNALSVANAASNAASIVSSRVASILSVDLSAHSQAISVLSQQVSVLSQAISVLSQLHSALSQQVSVLSSQVSVVSVAVTSVDSRVNTVSQQVSVLSQAVSVLSQAWSVLSVVSARTTAATSVKGMQAIVNALSGRISAAVGGGGFVASARTTADTSVQGAQSVVNALSSRISAISNVVSILSVNAASANNAVSAQAASALSQAISALSQTISVASAAAASANNAVSAQAASALSDSVSVGTATANALSNAISALSLAVNPRRVVLTTVATVSSSAMTNISGMSISVNAGETCQFKAFMFVNRGAVGTVMGYGFTFPKMTRIRGRIIVPVSVLQGGIEVVSDIPFINLFNGDSASGSILVSTIAMSLLSVFVEIEAVMVVSTGGVVQMQMRAAAGASAATVLAGSYMQVLKIG